VTTSRTLVVGFDGSSDAESALRWALHEARSPHDVVVVVHAAGVLEHLGSPLPRNVTPARLIELARRCDFDERRLRWVVDDGDACSVLLRAVAPPINADLLVVGSRGLGRRDGYLLGSTSLEVAQHATVPVVVVPNNHAGS
jgi:nucleotide-binding universal stress UspA family protein